MTIATPEAVKKMCRMFGQDMDLMASALDELVPFIVHNIEHHEAAVIAPFLDDLLSGRHTPDEIKDWWWSTPASMAFHDGQDVIKVLSLIRAALRRPPLVIGP